MVEALGQITAFLPDLPSADFREPHCHGYIRICAIWICQDEANWVRGWDVTLFNGDDEFVEQRYLDQAEAVQLRELLRKQSDADVAMGYQFQSTEGIVFKIFRGMQRISMLAPGVGTRNGVDGKKIVERVVAFLDSSAKLWE
jgi:hypothetical protein